MGYEIDLQTNEAIFFPNARLVNSISGRVQSGLNASLSMSNPLRDNTKLPEAPEAPEDSCSIS